MLIHQRLVYFNGKYIPECEARISIFDCALMYGDMVFEMTRSYEQKPFQLRNHLERLYASMDYVEIDCGLNINEMEEATYRTIEKNLDAINGIDFQIMHDITRGALDMYSSIVKEGNAPIVSINIFPLIKHLGTMAQKYKDGVHFVITPQKSVPFRYIDPKAKNRSRIYYKIAELQANRIEEGAMALLTDENGFITEGTGNNFFMVKNGEIYTPKPNDILRGVSRDYCLNLAESLGLQIHETDVAPYDVRTADEAWFTSTTVCMIPITRFEFRQVGDGQPGKIYQLLLDEWSKTVNLDIVHQASEYAKLNNSWTP